MQLPARVRSGSHPGEGLQISEAGSQLVRPEKWVLDLVVLRLHSTNSVTSIRLVYIPSRIQIRSMI